MKKTSDHFDGRHYYHPQIPKRTLWQVVRWIWKRKVKRWPSVFVAQQKIKRERTLTGECEVTFINHSTVLIQLEGWNILTDPIWSKRASPISWIGPKRVCLPGIRFEDLPPIDLILLSHNHYDHMDLPTLKRLSRNHEPLFFVPKGNKKYLIAKGLKADIQELDWWDQVDISKEYQLYFVPSQHFSARGLFDRDRTLWGGFVIKGKRQMIYFAGDTGFGPHFAEIQERLGSPTLSLLPIGAFEPRSFMKSVHLSPEDAVKAHVILRSKQSLAIHFGTFQLADEDIHTPVEELKNALKDYHLSQECFWALAPGESKELN